MSPDMTPFEETYVPERIHVREYEIGSILSTLDPLMRKQETSHVWLHGPPGTGKTLAVRFILKHFSQRASGIDIVMINCWHNNSFHSIVDHLFAHFGKIGVNSQSTRAKLVWLLRRISSRRILVVLDEVDTLPAKGRGDLLYILASQPFVTMLCMTRSDSTYFRLDERIRSRMTCTLVEFPQYSQEQIDSIMHGCIENINPTFEVPCRMLRLISRFAGGDARIALTTLKAIIEKASAGRAISHKDLYSGLRKSMKVKESYYLNNLIQQQHHRMIYDLIKFRPGIRSSELWTKYVKQCRRTKETPVARRTFTGYINRLENLNLIVSTIPPIKGKEKAFRPRATLQ